MTENDGGTPRDPQPETPPTQPLPGSTPPAAHEPVAPDVDEQYGQATSAPYAHEAGAPYAQEAGTPYAQEAGTPYAQEAATPYGQPGAPAAAPYYGYAAAPPKNDLGVWALITGILSYVMCPLLLGVAAIITGTMGRRAADEGQANNRGMATAGLILGWINVGLAVLAIVFFAIALAVGLFAGGIGALTQMGDVTY